MIHETLDRNPRCQLGDPSGVIAVKVGGDEIVQILATDFPLQHADDALGVTPVEARPAGVHENRLGLGRDDQCRGATLDIDPENPQVLGSERTSGQDR